MIPGRGVAAKVEGYHVLAGNRAMLNENIIIPDDIWEAAKQQTFQKYATSQALPYLRRSLQIFEQSFQINIFAPVLHLDHVDGSDSIRLRAYHG